MALPTMGTLSYGSYTFDEKSKSSVRSRANWDEAGRTITDWEYTIFVRGYVTPGGQSDTEFAMNELVSDLQIPCQKLTYDDGMGWALNVNDPSTGLRDVAYGPKPTLISFVPLGGGSSGNQAALVEWSCTTRIPTCSGGSGSFVSRGKTQQAIMALNYDWGHHVDGAGLSRITISGYLEIPLTRNGSSREVQDTADRYREHLEKMESPTNYRRESLDINLSKDRRRLNFSWQWIELPFAMPEGCAYADIDQDVSWSLDKAAYLRHFFSGRIVVAPGNELKLAVDKWKVIVANRLGLDDAGIQKILAGKKRGANQSVVIDQFTVREKIVGEGAAARTVTFSTSYRTIGARLHQILQAGGLWQPILQHDHGIWRTSMKDALSIRGADKVYFGSRSQEAIIDLCLASAKADHRDGAADANKKDMKGEVKLFGDNARRELIPKEASWVDYRCAVVMSEYNSLAMHKPLAGSSGVRNIDRPSENVGSQNQPSNPSQAGTFSTPYAKSATATHPSQGTNVENVFQQVGAPEVDVFLVGKALRYAHQIPTPKLVSVAGQEVVQMGQEVSQWAASAVAGLPMYIKTWIIHYKFKKPPEKMPVAENPALQLPASTAAEMLGD